MSFLSEPDILFVVNSLSGGGAENSIGQVRLKLLEDGYRTRLCALNNSKIDSNKVNEKDIYVLNRDWKAGIKQTLCNFFEFKKLLRSLKPDVIVANCELPELYIAFGAPFSSKIVAVEHTSNPWAGRRILGLIVRRVLKIRKVRWVTVLSSKQKIWNGTTRPIYIANPIVVDEVTSELVHQELKVVFIGRLRLEKRPEWALEAALEAGLPIDLFGDGQLREALEKKYLRQSTEVIFHGYVSEPWRQISMNSIVVVPSEYEGDGMVIAEAIIRGRAILLADNFDLRRFALPENNYFKSVDDLSAKLRTWKEKEGRAFEVPLEIISSLKGKRRIDSIAEDWKELLFNHIVANGEGESNEK